MKSYVKPILITVLIMVMLSMLTSALSFIPLKINIRYPALLVSREDEGQNYSKTYIILKGKYYTPIFKEHYFEGDIYVEGLPIGLDTYIAKHRVKDYDTGILITNIFYYSVQKESTSYVRYGDLFTSKDFNMFILLPYDPDYHDTYIVAPARREEDVKAIKEKLQFEVRK